MKSTKLKEENYIRPNAWNVYQRLHNGLHIKVKDLTKDFEHWKEQNGLQDNDSSMTRKEFEEQKTNRLCEIIKSYEENNIILFPTKMNKSVIHPTGIVPPKDWNSKINEAVYGDVTSSKKKSAKYHNSKHETTNNAPNVQKFNGAVVRNKARTTKKKKRATYTPPSEGNIDTNVFQDTTDTHEDGLDEQDFEDLQNHVDNVKYEQPPLTYYQVDATAKEELVGEINRRFPQVAESIKKAEQGGVTNGWKNTKGGEFREELCSLTNDQIEFLVELFDTESDYMKYTSFSCRYFSLFLEIIEDTMIETMIPISENLIFLSVISSLKSEDIEHKYICTLQAIHDDNGHQKTLIIGDSIHESIPFSTLKYKLHSHNVIRGKLLVEDTVSGTYGTHARAAELNTTSFLNVYRPEKVGITVTTKFKVRTLLSILTSRVNLITYIQSIASSLRHMHDRHIYHGELHPLNILIPIGPHIKEVYYNNFDKSVVASEKISEAVIFDLFMLSTHILNYGGQENMISTLWSTHHGREMNIATIKKEICDTFGDYAYVFDLGNVDSAYMYGYKRYLDKEMDKFKESNDNTQYLI